MSGPFRPIIEFIRPKIHDNSEQLIPENTQNEKSTQRRRKHCALAVVRRSQKFPPAADPFPRAWDGQNLISWRWSLPLPADLVWWRSMHASTPFPCPGVLVPSVGGYRNHEGQRVIPAALMASGRAKTKTSVQIPFWRWRAEFTEESKHMKLEQILDSRKKTGRHHDEWETEWSGDEKD